jgi:hypothetical protein
VGGNPHGLAAIGEKAWCCGGRLRGTGPPATAGGGQIVLRANLGTGEPEAYVGGAGVTFTVAIVVVGAAVCIAIGRAWRRTSDQAGTPIVLEAPIKPLGATMLVFSIPPGSRLAGVSVAELRVRAGGIAAVIRREGRLVKPTDHTLVRVDDQVLIAVPVGLEPATRQRVHAVSSGGRLAGWYDDDERIGSADGW